MFIDFEGIDGSGKTTLSNLVAARLRKRGYRVSHARDAGTLQAPAARRIRELTRDAQLLELDPRTEFFLNLARDAQQLAEVIKPALERGELCITDRYLYSQRALSAFGRGLCAKELEPAIALASQGIWPDLVILVDVDPDLARLRKRLGKLGQPKTADSRKGLVGAGLSVRVREAFLQMARQDPARWLVIENDDQPLWILEQRIVDAVVARLEGREVQVQRILPRKPPSAPITAQNLEVTFERAMDGLQAREPALCAFLLAGLPGAAAHRRRLSLMSRHPAVIARGLLGVEGEASWALRHHLAATAPAEVLGSLGSDPSERAMALRFGLFDRAPAAAVSGLRHNSSEEAWALRDEAWSLGARDAVLQSLGGLDCERAWERREQAEREGRRGQVAKSLAHLASGRAEAARQRLVEANRLAVLRSTVGLDTPFAKTLRLALFERATKVVMRSLSGVDTPYAWELRREAAASTKEALDSVDGMDTPEAWALREEFATRWPTTALSSLRPLPFTERARALVERVLAEAPDRLPVLRNAYAALAVGRCPQRQAARQERFARRTAAELGV